MGFWVYQGGISSVPNGCPCWYVTDPKRRCKCTPNQIERYLSRISGPLVDRIDIHVDVPAVPFRELTDDRDGTSSDKIRQEVVKARSRQAKRLADENILTNSRMNSRQVRKYCKLYDPGQTMIKQAVYELGLSARAHSKVLKIARTIADLEESDNIQSQHIAEAIQYRRLDRNL